MDFSTILSSAGKLKKNSLYKITIAESTKELLYTINTAILNAHEAGLSQTDVKLPINFKRIDSNITNRELQISIYFNIIAELERMGYEAKLKIDKSFTLVRVSWVVRATDSLLEEMQNKILSLTF
jgi:hypothetical protein